MPATIATRMNEAIAIAARLKPRGPNAWVAPTSAAALPLLLIIVHVSIGLRPEHFAIVAALLLCAWAGERGRQLVLVSSPFVAIGLAYDFLRLVIHLRGPVQVAALWHAEHAVFGSAAHWISTRHHPALDLLCGLVYILYLTVPILLAVVLFLRRHDGAAMRLSFNFFLCSLLGWAIWLAWPAAPPWYVDRYGLGPVVLDAPSSAAGGLRFDQLLGVDVFSSFYARSSNVFGAMPSLHVAYGMLPTFGVLHLVGWPRIVAAAWTIAMAFSAVYLRHHYVLDVVAGAILMVLSDAVFRRARVWASGRVPVAVTSSGEVDHGRRAEVAQG